MKQMNRVGLMILAAALLAGVLTGCGAKPESEGLEKERPMTGETVDKSDPDAPKTIESREIVRLGSRCFLYDLNDGTGDGMYEYLLNKDENGVVTLEEKSPETAFSEVDPEILTGVQEIIEKYDLVKKNGVDVRTAGLAPEYQPCMLKVEYASGETLCFTENGDPTTDWAWEMRSLFRQELAQNDYPELKTDFEEPHSDNLGMPSPMIACGSLDEVNEAVGCELMHLPVMGVTDRDYSLIRHPNMDLGQYQFDFLGGRWTYRAAPTEEDISGIYVDGGCISDCLTEDAAYYEADGYYYCRWFKDGMQYSLACEHRDTVTGEQFLSTVNELKSMMGL